MNAYVESNFVLELALVQEQHASCEEILALCEAGDIRIVVPAYSIVEPYETLLRRHLDRKRLKDTLDRELQQLSRTSGYAHRLSGFEASTALLLDSAAEEIQRLEDVRSRLLDCATVIALEAFLTRDSDFGDPDVVDELKARRCKLIPRFDSGFAYLSASLRGEST